MKRPHSRLLPYIRGVASPSWKRALDAAAMMYHVGYYKPRLRLINDRWWVLWKKKGENFVPHANDDARASIYRAIQTRSSEAQTPKFVDGSSRNPEGRLQGESRFDRGGKYWLRLPFATR